MTPSCSNSSLLFTLVCFPIQYCIDPQVQYSLTSIRGVGRRFSNLICKKAEVDPNKR